MATTTNVTTSFKGQLAGTIIEQAFKEGDTLKKGLIKFLPNVIGNAMLPKVNVTNTLALDTCGWAPTGTVNYVEKEVITKRYALPLELCKLDFARTYMAEATNTMDDIPSTIQEAILADLIAQTGELVDAQIWQGNNSSAQFDGFIPQFAADGTTIKVTATTVTSANVVAELTKIYNAIPVAIRFRKDTVIVVANDIASAYVLAQASMGNNTTVGDKPLDFAGVRIEQVGGMPTGKAVAYANNGNLAFATGLASELNSVDVSDTDATLLDNSVRAKIAFNAGVGYTRGEQVVLYA